ncbi:MAG: TonB-dependent receptor [Gemmatimonadetes bacterium]|nr:TonB-dependent receptor [Gemmatimonadota bacterium]
MIRIVPLFLATILAAAGAGSAAQEPTGSVEGIVHDSTSGLPLADAAVFLWDTPHRTATDATGRFTLDSVPAGAYDLLFFHERLASLGLSAGPVQVRVRPGERVSVDLATPSMETVLGGLCALEEGEGSAAAVGRVSDATSGVSLPGARVHVSWVPEGGRAAETRSVLSDDAGWYRACALPAGERVAVVASFLDRASPRREISLGHDEVRAVDLGVGTARSARLRGTLVDGHTGERIGGAEVWLEGTSRRMVSSPDGDFAFPELTPGAYTLGVRHLAYGSRTDSLNLSGGSDVSVSVALDSRAVPLDPITVTVEGAELADRAIGGTLITRAQVDEIRGRARDLAEVLRGLRQTGIVVRRSTAGLCIGFTQGQARMSFRGDCVPALVYIDNVRAADPQVAATLPVEAIDRIILLRPVEAGNLFGMGSGSGVVLIYTKSR